MHRAGRRGILDLVGGSDDQARVRDIADAIAVEIVNRLGRRADMQTPEIVRVVPRHEREISIVVAKNAGFSNDQTFRQAKEIVEATEADP